MKKSQTEIEELKQQLIKDKMLYKWRITDIKEKWGRLQLYCNYGSKELYQIIDMFKNREMYEKMDAKLPKGVLIYGNPGMGKTMLASALIEECNVKSFVIKKNKDDKEILDEIKALL